MGRKQPHVGVLFYVRTDARHITVESVSQQLKPDITAKARRDPLEIFLARHITVSPVIVVNEDTPVDVVIKLMVKHELGCLIVTNKEGIPVGIITKGDIIAKVSAEGTIPSKMTAKDVMTSPIITIDSEVCIREVARMMNRFRIGRLGIIYKNVLVGMVSKSDVVEFLPKLTEIPQETLPWTRQ